jgi:hypothetical protein
LTEKTCHKAMLDTVTLCSDSPFAWTEIVQQAQAGIAAPETGWKVHPYGTLGEHVALIAEHRGTGLKVIGPPEGAKKIEASLPRLLFGCNNQLIRNAHDLKTAIERLYTVAREVSLPMPSCFSFCRLDLVCYVPVQPSFLIHIYRHTRHPQFRKRPAEHPGETLSWGNGRLIFYDKLRQLGYPISDERTRVELRLRGKFLLKLFGLRDGDKLRAISLTQCYHAYRTFLLRFPEQPTASEYSEDALLAYCISRQFPAPDGKDMVAWRTSGLKPDTARKIRKRVAAQIPTCAQFSWADYLPQNPLGVHLSAEPVDVMPRSSSTTANCVESAPNYISTSCHPQHDGAEFMNLAKPMVNHLTFAEMFEGVSR